MRPWRRSWRATGTFALLSPLARAVFREIFTELVEDDGTMALGGRPLGDEVCRRLGVERHERRIFRRCVEDLLSDGCIVVRDGVAHLPGWERYQADGATTKTARKRSSARPLSSSAEPLTGLCESPDGPLRDLCVTSDGPSDEAKPMESFNTTWTEEKRVEESRREKTTSSACAGDKVTPARLWRALDDGWFRATGERLPGLFGSRQRLDLERLVERYGADAVREDIRTFVDYASAQRPVPHSPWGLYVTKAGAWGRQVAASREAARGAKPMTGILSADETEAMMRRKLGIS